MSRTALLLGRCIWRTRCDSPWGSCPHSGVWQDRAARGPASGREKRQLHRRWQPRTPSPAFSTSCRPYSTWPERYRLWFRHAESFCWPSDQMPSEFIPREPRFVPDSGQSKGAPQNQILAETPSTQGAHGSGAGPVGQESSLPSAPAIKTGMGGRGRAW